MSLNVAIVSNGKYGERAQKIISKKFNCDFIKLDYFGDFENITIDKNQLEKLKKYDIIITYITNPDLTYILIDNLKNSNNVFVLVGAWKGKGFKKQLEKYNNVYCPELMCNFNENNLKEKIKDYPQIKEFLNYFGTPKVNIYLDEHNIIKNIEIKKEALCGSTVETLNEFLNKKCDKDLLTNIGLRVQHFCRAGRIRIFSEKEGKKSRAGKCLVNNINIIKNNINNI